MEEERTNKSEELNDKFKNFLADLTGNCFDVAEDIYFDVCNKVEKRLNETFSIEGNFPENFTFFDRLSQRKLSESYDEIAENLEESIRKMIEEEVANLSRAEKLVLEYSTIEFTPDNRPDLQIVYNRIMHCFEEMLTERREGTCKQFSI